MLRSEYKLNIYCIANCIYWVILKVTPFVKLHELNTGKGWDVLPESIWYTSRY